MELSKYLLKLPGVHYLLSEKLCQDPLESFFGQQRMRGGSCSNPTVNDFIYGTSSLRVQGSTALKPFRGNVKRGKRSAVIEVDDTPLAKRPRSANAEP